MEIIEFESNGVMNRPAGYQTPLNNFCGKSDKKKFLWGIRPL
jgi:hypothetical protein